MRCQNGCGCGHYCSYECSSVSDTVSPVAMDAPVSVTLSTMQLWMLQCQWHCQLCSYGCSLQLWILQCHWHWILTDFSMTIQIWWAIYFAVLPFLFISTWKGSWSVLSCAKCHSDHCFVICMSLNLYFHVFQSWWNHGWYYQSHSHRYTRQGRISFPWPFSI